MEPPSKYQPARSKDLDVQIPQPSFAFPPDDAVDTLVVHKRPVDVKAPPEQFGYNNVFLPFAE